jgi:hypothetical protein
VDAPKGFETTVRPENEAFLGVNQSFETLQGLVCVINPVMGGTWVKSQSPVGGTLVAHSSTVTLTLAKGGHPTP